ncbi:BRO family protein [Brochothrix thermosphacta]|uniref:BRO family protein n=1 Tax=Brochothrix thermosphacta TaxID=2756 RepID=UPI0039AFA148
MKSLTVINQQEVLGKNFRVYGDTENPLFLAKDVAYWIDYDLSNVSKMVKNVDEEEKLITRTNNTNATFLTEDGLYEVLMQSRKPIAKKFKKEVKHILKEIRKTGAYQVPTDPMSALKLMFDATSQIDSRVTELEENAPLSPSDYGYITGIVNKKVGQVIAERQLSPNKKQRSLLYKELNSEVKKITGTPTRSQLRQRHFTIVTDFIRDWQPSNAALVVYKQLELTESEVD